MLTRSLATAPTIDLSRPIALVRRDNPEWSSVRLSSAADEYLCFLQLCKMYPEQKISAPPDVDRVWHAHMLDSINYMRDCEAYFGYYLHHDPCIGDTGGVADAEATLSTYERTFGIVPPSAWQGLMTCANPGNGCGSIPAN